MLKRFFLNDNIILGVIILNSITILLGAFDNLSTLQLITVEGWYVIPEQIAVSTNGAIPFFSLTEN